MKKEGCRTINHCTFKTFSPNIKWLMSRRLYDDETSIWYTDKYIFFYSFDQRVLYLTFKRRLFYGCLLQWKMSFSIDSDCEYSSFSSEVYFVFDLRLDLFYHWMINWFYEQVLQRCRSVIDDDFILSHFEDRLSFTLTENTWFSLFVCIASLIVNS